MRNGLEALARAIAFRERALEYRKRAAAAEHITAREAYLQLALTYGRLADDMDSVARTKRFTVEDGKPAD